MKAQDIVYDAWQETSPRARIALDRKALGISPLRADALNLPAEEAKSATEARDLSARAVEARHFWRSLETRPDMRVRVGLAGTLRQRGDEDGHVSHYRETLKRARWNG